MEPNLEFEPPMNVRVLIGFTHNMGGRPDSPVRYSRGDEFLLSAAEARNLSRQGFVEIVNEADRVASRPVNKGDDTPVLIKMLKGCPVDTSTTGGRPNLVNYAAGEPFAIPDRTARILIAAGYAERQSDSLLTRAWKSVKGAVSRKPQAEPLPTPPELQSRRDATINACTAAIARHEAALEHERSLELAKRRQDDFVGLAVAVAELPSAHVETLKAQRDRTDAERAVREAQQAMLTFVTLPRYQGIDQKNAAIVQKLAAELIAALERWESERSDFERDGLRAGDLMALPLLGPLAHWRDSAQVTQ